MKNLLDTKAVTVGVVAVVIGGGVLYLVKKYGAQALQSINPTSDKNAAYTGVNAVGSAITGDQDFSLGSWLYDLTHAEYDPNSEMVRSADVLRSGAAATDSLWGRIGNVLLRSN